MGVPSQAFPGFPRLSQAFPGLLRLSQAFPGLPSSLILTFSVPKACLERLLQNSHLLAVSIGLGCIFFREDISVPLWAGVLVKG